MTVKRVHWLPCFLALAMALLPPSALAANARLPYSLLCAMQKTQQKLSQEHTNLTLVLQIRSMNPEVKFSDVTVRIDSKSGPIPIPVASEGVFTVPIRDDLVAENPWVIVNQPTGTMELSWHAGLAPAVAKEMTNSIRYGKLMRAVQEIESVQESMRQFFPNAPRLSAVGVRLAFHSKSIAPAARIHTKEGLHLLTADRDNQLIIPMVKDLMEEDPVLNLTENPIAIEIVTRKEE